MYDTAMTMGEAIAEISAGIDAAFDAGVPYERDTVAYMLRDLNSGTAPGLVAVRFAEGFYGK